MWRCIPGLDAHAGSVNMGWGKALADKFVTLKLSNKLPSLGHDTPYFNDWKLKHKFELCTCSHLNLLVSASLLFIDFYRAEWMLLLYRSCCAFLASSSSPKSVSAALKFEQISCLGVLCSSVLTLMIMSLQPALFRLYFTAFKPWTTSWQREKIVTETHLCVITEDVWLFSHKEKRFSEPVLIKISSGDQGLGFHCSFYVPNFKVEREFTLYSSHCIHTCF